MSLGVQISLLMHHSRCLRRGVPFRKTKRENLTPKVAPAVLLSLKSALIKNS